MRRGGPQLERCADGASAQTTLLLVASRKHSGDLIGCNSCIHRLLWPSPYVVPSFVVCSRRAAAWASGSWATTTEPLCLCLALLCHLSGSSCDPTNCGVSASSYLASSRSAALLSLTSQQQPFRLSVCILAYPCWLSASLCCQCHAAAQKVEIAINPDGSFGTDTKGEAPKLAEMVSKLRPAPGSGSSAPAMESQSEQLMRALREAIPSPAPGLKLSKKEADFQQMILQQLNKDEELKERAKKVQRPSSGVELTAAELSQYDGSDPDRPIYLSIRRRLFDVTDGIKYYGSEGKYNYLVGREVARALATGCFESSGLSFDVRGLTQQQLDTIAGWQNFYARKYSMVGHLKAKKVREDDPMPDDDCPEASRYAGRPDL